MVNQGYNTTLVGNGRFGYGDLEAVERAARKRNAVMRKIKADMRKMEKRRKGGK